MFLSINNLNKHFGTNHVLKNVSTNLKKGEVMSVIGPSGSGKSTFLKCINFLEYPTSGTVNLDGEPKSYRWHFLVTILIIYAITEYRKRKKSKS